MGIFKRAEPEQEEPVLPPTPEELEQGFEPADAISRERKAWTLPEFNPYDNWPRYSQWWPETEKGA